MRGPSMKKIVKRLLLYFGILMLAGCEVRNENTYEAPEPVQIQTPENEEVNNASSANQSKTNDIENLPIYENTSVYPEFSFADLTNEATYILNAEVIEVGDSFMKEIPVSLTENPEDASEVLSYPVTPIKLGIETTIKGNTNSDEFIYYEDGGITDTCIILPSGYAMEEGYNVILFLNSDGYCWGEQSIYPVIGNNVILNEAAIEYFDDNVVSSMEVEDITSNIRSQINAQSVMVTSIDNFVSSIQELKN